MNDEQYRAARTLVAQNEVRLTHLNGRLEAIYDGLSCDEELIEQILAETKLDREAVASHLSEYAEKQIARLRSGEEGLAPRTEVPEDGLVLEFRDMSSRTAKPTDG